MFIVEEMKSPVVIEEQQENGEYTDVLYTHHMIDTKGLFKPWCCKSDYDILKHNKDYFTSELKWKRKHSMPTSVERNGFMFNCDSATKTALRDKIESSLYADKTFSFKAVNGNATLTQEEARTIRDTMEVLEQSAFEKYNTVLVEIEGLTMESVPSFDLEKSWEAANV